MEGAVFEVISKDGNIVCKLTTDKDGLATSIPLIVGKYTLKSTSTKRIYVDEGTSRNRSEIWNGFTKNKSSKIKRVNLLFQILVE